MDKRLQNLTVFNKAVLLKLTKKYIPEIDDGVSHKHLMHLIKNDKRLRFQITFEELLQVKKETDSEYMLILEKQKNDMIKWAINKSHIIAHIYRITPRWPNDPCYFKTYEHELIEVDSIKENGDILQKNTNNVWKINAAKKRWFLGDSYILMY